jgi:hypothetical protein
VHRAGNGFLGFCAAELSRGPILDVCSGFWGLRTDKIADLHLESVGFEIESELFVKAFRRGLRICQLPITYRKRLGIAKLHAVRDGVRIFLSILRHSGRTPGSIRGTDARRRGTARGWALARGRPELSLPSLSAILLTLSPKLVVVASSPKRREEAVGLAEALPYGPFSVVLELSEGDPVRRFAGPGPWSADDAGPFGLQDRPVVVSLPDPPIGVAEFGGVVVSIPGQSWGVSLVPPRAPTAVAPAERTPTGPLGRAALALSPPTPWVILGSILDPTWSRRQWAVLGTAVDAFGGTVVRLPLPGALPRLERLDKVDPPHLPEGAGTAQEAAT